MGRGLGWLLGLVLVLVLAGRVSAASGALDPTLRTQIIEKVTARIASAYVLPDVALQIEAALHAHATNQDYDTVRSVEELCTRLTADLRQVSGDLHLEVIYQEKSGPKAASALNGVGRTARDQTLAGKLTNFGFETVSRLEGNVGYLDLREFYAVENGFETAAAAMAFLGNTDALIIDLRENPGGAVSMNSLLSTYLLGRKQIHLNGLRGREPGQAGELWTVPQAPRSIYSRDVYLLTSSRTFSQAEAFAYQLQQLKRATLVGERTGGGAHLVEFEPIVDHVVLRLPKGRFVHPVTQTNWQGVGVTPDVETSSGEALTKAYLLALTQLQNRNTNPELSANYRRLVTQAQRDLDDARLPRTGASRR
jgi:hypothetical protein